MLDSTVAAYQQSLDLTKVLYDTGIDSDESVAQADTQLESTQAQATAVGILRAQYEHAIALLVGSPHRPFPYPWDSSGPSRRIFLMACPRSSSNAARILPPPNAAWPSQRPNRCCDRGFLSDRFSQRLGRLRKYVDCQLVHLAQPLLVRWSLSGGDALRCWAAQGHRPAIPCRLRSAGGQLSPYRPHGLPAGGRQSCRSAHSPEIEQQDTAVNYAERSAVATDRYRLGIDPYLNVITAQTTLLSNQQTAESSHAANGLRRPTNRSPGRKLEHFRTPLPQ